MDTERLHIFFERFPRLAATLTALNKTNIPFAIGGSGCLFLLGNERLPDDVDIYLPNNCHDQADYLFSIVSFAYRSTQENVRNSNPNGDHAIQLTSGLVFTIEGKQYSYSLTPDIIANRIHVEFNGLMLSLFPPEDVLLIKALLQRGPDVGKHDLEDIQNFMSIYPGLRRDYLNSRIATIGAEERVGDIFHE
ncbi:MAG: hypothetical protein NUV56_02480 [Candidatus Uhrbacteria bacterium]|nr:hypothetical protein [Candidatus Uhrbacteria bacterium]